VLTLEGKEIIPGIGSLCFILTARHAVMTNLRLFFIDSLEQVDSIIDLQRMFTHLTMLQKRVLFRSLIRSAIICCMSNAIAIVVNTSAQYH